ncbi:hypothetical protein Clacol_009034 [Clathrus columnatus]|uniref:F-box domain-containing protein n=1 Tax=Clathrus columnatus TaxID=1419009 RepID=A0AAV5AQV4_9AGAM|nr:hypothetical protein Clacol_009034 [Clathrus columnatus]
MAIFADLPIELLPLILSFVIKPHHLTQCCLLNKTFASFATSQLYEKIYIYAWHKESKTKVRNLFRTLSAHPELAKWVRRLELRDFPKVFSVAERHALTQLCAAGLNNCSALQACTWTRDQTLTSEILEALKGCLSLTELEINGHSITYSPESLLEFTSLTKISLIMPSAEVIALLPLWLEKNALNLISLQVICKSSGLLTDQTLSIISPSLIKLKHLHLIGCIKVTHQGIGALLHSNETGFESLGLEGLSLSFVTNFFLSLQSITLTLPNTPITSQWTTEFLSFTEHSSLTRIHLYQSTGVRLKARLNTGVMHGFMESLLWIHASRLQTLSVHRLNLDPQTIDLICLQCPHLENLFVVVNTSEIDEIIPSLSKSKTLRNIHINFPFNSNVGRLPPDKVLQIAMSISPQLQQIGFANRTLTLVQIRRVARLNEYNEITVDVSLGPYEQLEVPEQFLVVKL